MSNQYKRTDAFARLFSITLILMCAIALATNSCAQNIAGQVLANQYGQWRVDGEAPDSYTFSPTSCRVQGGASFFYAFSPGTPILIVDGDPALDEVVMPSAVIEDNSTCAITINPIHHHDVPFYLTSATGGLQEAINANISDPGKNTIVLSNAWYQQGGSATVIGSVKGISQLGLMDVTTLPSNWYQWNGMQYELVSLGSGGTVTSVTAGSWPSWLTPSVTDPTTTPSINVTASPIPIAALASSTITLGTTSVSLGATIDSAAGFNAATASSLQTAPTPCPAGEMAAGILANGNSTGCTPSAAAKPGWMGTLTNAMGAGDSSVSINLSGGTLPVSGYFLVDSEWILFNGYTSLGDGIYTLNNLVRGEYTTGAATHASGDVISLTMIMPLVPDTQALSAFIGGGSLPEFFAVGCPTATNENGTILALFGCGGLNISSDGGFSDPQDNYITGSLTLGWLPGSIETLDASEPLIHGSDILQNNQPNVISSAIAFPNGIPGGVKSVTAPPAPAPVVDEAFLPAGTATYSYECTGTDELGGNIPGSTGSIPDVAATEWGPNAKIYVSCIVPGATSITLYRTAGGPNQGILATTSGAVINEAQDTNATLPTGSPNSTNTSIPHTCVNGLQFCALSGTSSTPPLSCSTTYQGWEYHNVSATASPFTEVCNGTSWVTAY